MKELQENIRQLILAIGEDPQREGLVKTPSRVANALKACTVGYSQDAVKILRSAIFEEDHRDVVLVRDIQFYSLCEHHLLPFWGKVHVAYIPDGKITGLSKLARTVEVFARRLQLQERMGEQICEALTEALAPRGALVVVEAEHMCMQMRGVEKPGSVTTTISASGVLNEDFQRRSEILTLLKK